MSLASSIKYRILGTPLSLKKKDDFCESKNPRLTVVMLHGIASDSFAFKNTLKYLRGTTSMKDIRFVTFDLLGAGKSYASESLEYTLEEQLEALHRSIEKLKAKTPLVLVGHSMGSLIALNYANTYKKSVQELILVSPPFYTNEDIKSNKFQQTMKIFEKVVGARNKTPATKKQFKNSMEYIVITDKNYKLLLKNTTKATIIYGSLDQLIIPHNIIVAKRQAPKILQTIKTIGNHPMSRDKYHKLVGILEEALND